DGQPRAGEEGGGAGAAPADEDLEAGALGQAGEPAATERAPRRLLQRDDVGRGGAQDLDARGLVVLEPADVVRHHAQPHAAIVPTRPGLRTPTPGRGALGVPRGTMGTRPPEE